MIQSEAMNEANEVDAGRDRAVGGGQIRIFVFNEAKRGPTRTPAVPDPESIAAQAAYTEALLPGSAPARIVSRHWGPPRACYRVPFCHGRPSTLEACAMRGNQVFFGSVSIYRVGRQRSQACSRVCRVFISKVTRVHRVGR